MLYDNGGGESLAFGDIEYISEYVNYYLEKNLHISTAKPNLKSVLKIINARDDIMLMKVVSKHCS